MPGGFGSDLPTIQFSAGRVQECLATNQLFWDVFVDLLKAFPDIWVGVRCSCASHQTLQRFKGARFTKVWAVWISEFLWEPLCSQHALKNACYWDVHGT